MAIADFFNEIVEIVTLMYNSLMAWISEHFKKEEA